MVTPSTVGVCAEFVPHSQFNFSRGLTRKVLWTTILTSVVSFLNSSSLSLADTPALLAPHLHVTTVLSTGIDQRIGLVFLPPGPPHTSDLLILEKATGRVLRMLDGVLLGTPVLDLSVNANSERGLLSMALHPISPPT